MVYKKKGYPAKPPGEAARNEVFGRYQHGAKSRGHSFDLTIEEFEEITKMLCHYCGDTPSNKAQSGKTTGYFFYNGIDRKDNAIGYTKDNSVPCCRVCNRAKNSMLYDDFIAWITRVVEFNKESKE